MGVFKPKDRKGWIAAVWHQNRKVGQKYFPTKVQAVEWHDKQKAKAYDGYLDRPAQPIELPVSVRALSGKWLTDLKDRRRSLHTLRFYRGRLRSSVLPTVGSKRIIEVTPQLVEKYFERLRAGATKSIDYQRILATWRALFRWAVVQKLTRLDPTAGVPKLRETPAKERVFLNRDQVRHVIDTTTGQVKLWAQLAFMTGMRPREIEAARIEWVDLDRQIIRVPDTLEFTSKGKSSRTIPLDKELASALAALDRTEGPILVSRRTRGHFAYSGSRNLSREAARVSGIGFTAYDARHTFCSWLVSSGVPISEVQKVMGHRRIETTMKYVHLAPDHLERVRWAIGGGKLKAVK